jgi:hypothetical protein
MNCRIEELTEMEILGAPSGTMGQIRKTTLQPWWAKSSGTDQYGPWADLLIGKQTYRFRLVPTGKYRKTLRYFDQRKKQELKTVVKIECLENEYWLGETEVTDLQIKYIDPIASYDDRPRATTWQWWTKQICSRLNKEYPNLGVNLPSEQQWEFACFAQGSGHPNQNLAEYAWYKDNSGNDFHPAKKKKPNAWGFYDMQGNIEELCREMYQSYWSIEDDFVSVQERDGFRKRLAAAIELRILKGGAYFSAAENCQVSSRIPVSAQAGEWGGRLCIPAK